MSCVLRIAGKNLDLDGFVKELGLKGFVKCYGDKKANPKTHPGKQYSFVSTMISRASIDSFERQRSGAMRYLNKNKKKLSIIRRKRQIEHATINFMVVQKSVSEKYFAQYFYLPPELIGLCTELGIGIEIAVV